MLHALESSDLRPYRLPWRVDRAHGTHPLITNASDHELEVVRVFIDVGHRVQETQQWGRVAVGETVELCLCDHDTSEMIVTLAWFRSADGAEYLWRFVL